MDWEKEAKQNNSYKTQIDMGRLQELGSHL